MEIQIRKGTLADWASANPILELGEPATTETKQLKIGDGTTPWNDLNFVAFDGGCLDCTSSTTTTNPPPPPPTTPPPGTTSPPDACAEHFRQALIQCYDCATNGISNVPQGTLITDVPGVQVSNGNCYCGTSFSAYNVFVDNGPGGSGTCPAGCVNGPSIQLPDCTVMRCFELYNIGQCQSP